MYYTIILFTSSAVPTHTVSDQTLIKWVNSNGLALNLKKTCYMVFSKRRVDLSSLQVKIDNTPNPIEHNTEARFLGVIVDEKLNWASSHVRAVKAECHDISFIGVMFKIKRNLPIKANYRSSKFCTISLKFLFTSLGLRCKIPY